MPIQHRSISKSSGAQGLYRHSIGEEGSGSFDSATGNFNFGPTAFFTVTPSSGTRSTIFSFDASGSTDPNGDPLNYRWDWTNDGVYDTAWSATPTATHQYSSVGTITAKLQVRDPVGETSTYTIAIEVVNQDPVALFTIDPASGNTETVFSFDASGSTDPDSDSLEYRWDWTNDGVYDTAWSATPTATHTYTEVGNYTAKLQVRDSLGATATYTIANIDVVLANTAPVASFTVTPSTGDNTTLFEVDASGCTDAQDPVGDLEVRWSWKNDGVWTAWTTVKTASHTYSLPDAGNYTIAMQVRDTGGLTDSTTQNITVEATIMYDVISFSEASDFLPVDSTKQNQSGNVVRLFESTLNDEFDDESINGVWALENHTGTYGAIYEGTGGVCKIRRTHNAGGWGFFANLEPHIAYTHPDVNFDVYCKITTKFFTTVDNSEIFFGIKNSSDNTKFLVISFDYWAGQYRALAVKNAAYSNITGNLVQTNIYFRFKKENGTSSGSKYTIYYALTLSSPAVNGDWTQLAQWDNVTDITDNEQICLGCASVNAGYTAFIAEFDDFYNYINGASTLIDDFSDNVLGVIWTEVNNTKGYINENTNDSLEFIAAETSSDFAGGIFTGMNAYKAITSGNFFIETKAVVDGADANYVRQILYVRDSSDTNEWVSLGLNYISNIALDFISNVNGVLSSIRRDTSITSTTIFLAIERIGNVFISYYKLNAGDDWTIFESVYRADIGAAVRVGIGLANLAAGTKRARVRYDYFRGGQYDAATAIENPTKTIVRASTITQLNSCKVHSSGSTGTTIITVQTDNRSTPDGWISETPVTITTNPQIITLNKVGDYRYRSLISQQAESTVDRGKDVDCIIFETQS